MTIIAAYQDAGSYRGAAAICGTTPKTVKRVIEGAEAGDAPRPRKGRARNYEVVVDRVAQRVKKSSGRITAKRLLPAARTAGHAGRVEHLVIDWGSRGGVHVFCAVLAWSRWRFVRFAADEKSTTTLAMLGECFAEIWGEVHKDGRQKRKTPPRL